MPISIATPFPVGVPKADGTQSLLDTLDLREKLQQALSDLELKRENLALALVTNFAQDTRAKPLNIEDAFQRNKAWQTADEQAAQRIEALNNILSKLDDHLARLKAENPDAVKSALTQKLEALNKALAEKSEATADLKDQIKKLQAEIDGISKGAAKKS